MAKIGFYHTHNDKFTVHIENGDSYFNPVELDRYLISIEKLQLIFEIMKVDATIPENYEGRLDELLIEINDNHKPNFKKILNKIVEKLQRDKWDLINEKNRSQGQQLFEDYKFAI